MVRSFHISLALIASFQLIGQDVFEATLIDTRAQAEDYAPVLRDSGFVMCSIRETAGGAIGFTDATTDLPLSDLYWVPYKDGVAGHPVLFSANLATPVNEGPAAFEPSGTTICYTRNTVLPRKLSNLRNANGQLGLFFSDLQAGIWSEPRAFAHNSTKHSVMHPAFGPEGNTLYFTSDMEGGYGGMDLYRCSREADGWSAPVNLGPMVNTAANEVFPTIDHLGILRFSSDREGGLGRLDLYSCAPSDNGWDRPTALPEPINSSANDVCYGPDPFGPGALFSSDRTGADRIYQARRTVPKFRDCTEQRTNNYCYAARTRAMAVTKDLPLEHVWDMGDGTRVTGSVVEHCYARPGRYEIRSMLVDRNSGDVFHVLRSNELVIEDIEQAFVTAPDTVRTGRAMELGSMRSNTSGKAIGEYHWDFGDGSLGTGPRTQHRYAQAGTYTVRLDLILNPRADGTILNQCNTKRVVVIDRFRDQEDMAVVATYQDALGNTHSFDYQELPFDNMGLDLALGEDASFSVELFASRHRLSLDDPRFTEIRKFYPVIERFDPERGMYSYSVGSSKTVADLYDVFRKVKELDFLDAEVFALKEEKLIDMSRLGLASAEELTHSKLRTNAIHFAFRSAALEAGSEPVLEQVTALMGQYPQLQVVIEAHTDDVGGSEYNMELSQQRAASVVDHLVANGIDPERLLPIGHGKNQPIASNRTEKGRGLNRRVEFRMVMKGEEQAFQKTR